MRSMAHPDYRYTPWTPERRKRASEKAKREWAARQSRAEAVEREDTFAEKFAKGARQHQHELLRAWLSLIVTYRESPSNPEFMKMLADCWEEMAKVVADDMRTP